MEKNVKTRIMVFGTFDILHPGHLNFFKQARKLAKNPYLIVSIARDVNVKKIKGKLPLNNERKRAGLVRKSHLTDRVVLGEVRDYINHIVRNRPQFIALGYDQTAYTKQLQEKLANRNFFVRILRMKPFKPNVYKSSIIKSSQLKN